MSHNLLKGKRGIIFGALDENSIAWKTALKVKEEGGVLLTRVQPKGNIRVEVAYLANNDDVRRMLLQRVVSSRLLQSSDR